MRAPTTFMALCTQRPLIDNRSVGTPQHRRRNGAVPVGA